MCVCARLPLRLLITSSVMWRGTPYDWLSKGYNFYMATTVIIGSKCVLKIEVCHGS